MEAGGEDEGQHLFVPVPKRILMATLCHSSLVVAKESLHLAIIPTMFVH